MSAREWEEKYLRQTDFCGYRDEKKIETINKLLHDSVDSNVWSGQDPYTGMGSAKKYPVGRPFSDIEIAIRASEAGMKAIVFQSHNGQSYFRTPVIQKIVDSWAKKADKRTVKVVGTVILNYPMGGLNPESVRMLARFGGKVVTMPTMDGWHHRKVTGLKGGIELVRNSRVVPELEEIIGIMAENDLVMDLTYVDAEQRFIIVDDAKTAGVKKFKIYHVDLGHARTEERWRIVAGTTEEQWIELVKKGVKLMEGHLENPSTLERQFELMKKIGFENYVGGTDLNQWPTNMHPVDGLRTAFMNLLIKGISESDIEKIYKTNPAKLFDL